MAIKRKTTIVEEEIDDSTDTTSPTGTNTSEKKNEFRVGKEIETGSYIKDNEQIEGGGFAAKNTPAAKTGRTYADVIMHFSTDARLISVLLFFLPLPFFASGITTLASLKFPLIAGLFLNLVWFALVPALQWVKIKIIGRAS